MRPVPSSDTTESDAVFHAFQAGYRVHDGFIVSTALGGVWPD